MAKTKLTLEVEYEYDFELIGISCHIRDYKLCWIINKEFNFDFKREDDIEINIKKKGNSALYPKFSFCDEDNRIQYYLISNRGSVDFLIPEQKKADYLFLIQGSVSETHIHDVVQNLKRLDAIQLAFRIDVDSLKSKQNLLF